MTTTTTSLFLQSILNPVFHYVNPDLFAGFVLPFTVANVGLLVPCFFFEWAVRQPYFEPYHITYRKGAKRYTRGDGHMSTVSTFQALAKMALWRVPFIAFIASTILYNLHLDMFSAKRLLEIPLLHTMLVHYIMYYYLSDFIAFCFHWCVHKNDFLWKHIHEFHHREPIPTALSGPYSSLWDYFTFGGMPNILAVLILQPHALVFYAGVLTNTYGVGYLHSGIQHPLFDAILSMGFMLPFHCTSRMHDRHHRYAGRKAQDLGEHCWLWDYCLGTLSKDGPV